MSNSTGWPEDRPGAPAAPGDPILVPAAPGPPDVSVIVAFLNAARHLPACIESLLSQEAPGVAADFFLVDNGSTDESAAIARRYAAVPDGRCGITLLREDTPGVYAARNAGIRHARAPILAFTDADCVADRGWLRAVLDGMRDPSVGVLLGACRYPEAASLPLRLLAAYENAKADYVVTRCAPAHHFAYANNMAVRASVFTEAGPFREWPRAADSELVHRMAAARPDLRLAFAPAMRVTHLEFLRARDRARRLALYTQTNSRIPTFRELGVAQRVGVITRLLRGPRAAA